MFPAEMGLRQDDGGDAMWAMPLLGQAKKWDGERGQQTL